MIENLWCSLIKFLIVFHCLKGMGDANYNLLLMCASEKEDGSYLASAWDEYRIVAHRCPSQEETRKFLFSQFKYVSATSGRDSPYAAAADEDR